MIKEGAVPITEIEDILRELNLLSLPSPKPKQHVLELPTESVTVIEPAAALSTAKLQSLTEPQRIIVGCLSLTPVHFDQIVRTTTLDVTVVGIELTMLELFKCVHRLPGNSYILMP